MSSTTEITEAHPAQWTEPRRGDRRGPPRLRTGPQARLPLLVGAGPAEADDGARPRRAPTSGTATATSFLDFSSQLVNTNIGHQHPKVVAAIAEQAAKLCTVAPAARQRRPLGGGPADRRAHARRPEQDLLHQRRRRRRGARRADGPAAHRPLQGARALPLVPRRHRHRGQPHRRPAPLAQRLRQQRRGALLRAVPVPLVVPRRDRGAGDPARARTPGAADPAGGPVDHRGASSWSRCPVPRASWCRRPDTWPACARSATATASCSSPTR